MLGLATAVVLLASCGGSGGANVDASEASPDVITELSERGLASAASALENLDLDDLAGTKDYTFLAPNDDAFLSLAASEAAQVMASDDTLGTVLRNHLIEGRLDLDDLESVGSVTAISGMELAVETTSDGLTIGGALVSGLDIEPGGQMIHSVDKIFLP